MDHSPPRLDTGGWFGFRALRGRGGEADTMLWPLAVYFAIVIALVVVLLVIFDLEAAFIFAWAVALREIGWSGYIEGVVFVGVLLAALTYLWRISGLDFVTRRSVS